MRILGLLLATVLCCPAFGQVVSSDISPESSLGITANGVHGSDTGQDVIDRLRSSRPQFDPHFNLNQPHAQLVERPDLQDDDTCYTMRTYVVARDSKTSDAVHPVRSSTCQPSKRFGLKTTEAPQKDNR